MRYTQCDSARYIVSEGVHFHFPVKGNQKNLLEATEIWFELEASSRPPNFTEQPVKDHGRIEHRSIWMTDQLNDHVSFPFVALAFVVRRQVTEPKCKKPPSVEIAYGLTSQGCDQTTAPSTWRACVVSH